MHHLVMARGAYRLVLKGNYGDGEQQNTARIKAMRSPAL
jgi:hypothetical protein